MDGFFGMGMVDGVVGGNTWPSPPNVSAFGPSFTVDRLNPNPNSTVYPYNNAGGYAPQSADGSELFADPVEATRMPHTDFRFSAESFSAAPSTTHWSSPTNHSTRDSSCAFGYPSYDTCVGGDGGVWVMDELSEKPSTTPAYGFDQSSIDWGWVLGLGFDNGKRPKMRQLDSDVWVNNANAVDSPYHSQSYQGVRRIENSRRYDAAYFPFALSNQSPDWGFLEGSSSVVGPVEDASSLEQNSSLFSYDMNNASGSAIRPTLPAYESPYNFSNYQSSSGLYKQFDKPSDPSFISSLTLRKPASVTTRSPSAFDRSSVQSFAFQTQEMNALGGSSVARDQVQVSTEIASDNVDPPNTAVDSPCWKGSRSSNSDRVLPESNASECTGSDELSSETDDSTIYSSEEQCSSNCTTHGVSLSSTTDQKGVETVCDSDKLKKDSKLLTSLTRTFDLNEAAECSVAAVLASEKLLGSPASQKDLECPKLNAKLVIKAMHNLSDLLQFYLSNDAFTLDEESLVSLEHTMSNLDSCVSKRSLLEMKKPKQNNPMGEPSKKLERQSSDVEMMSGSSHTVNNTTNSYIEPNSYRLHQKEEICNFSGKKDEKSLHFTPFADDLDISTNDGMTKAIHRVLEENFAVDEDMNSQSQLFKSLWLESEAKLCSISYKARFNRMKTQMESLKQKAKENKYLSEMMSKECVRSGLATAPGCAVKSRGVTYPDSNSKKSSDLMVSLNSPNSPRDNLNPINAEEEQRSKMDVQLMGLFNDLKSREDNSKSISTEEEEIHAMNGGDLTADVKPCIGDHSEKERLYWDVIRSFQGQIDTPSLGKFDSDGDDAACPSAIDFVLSVINDEAVPSSSSNTATNEDQNTEENESNITVTNNQAIPPPEENVAMNNENTGGDDCSCSDWEYILKDDFS